LEGLKGRGRFENRWVDNITSILRDIGIKSVDRFICLRIEIGGRLFKHSNKPFGTIKCRKFD
jgi:hypothetical protein